MREQAMEYTRDDISSLKASAEKNLKGGTSSGSSTSILSMLDNARREITHLACMKSRGRDRSFYECLAKGTGLLICSRETMGGARSYCRQMF